MTPCRCTRPRGAMITRRIVLALALWYAAAAAAGAPATPSEVVAAWPHDRCAFTQGLVFRDGELYFMSLPPGEYRVRIAARILDRLGMRMADPDTSFRLVVPEEWDQLQTIDVKLIAEARSR